MSFCWPLNNTDHNIPWWLTWPLWCWNRNIAAESGHYLVAWAQTPCVVHSSAAVVTNMKDHPVFIFHVEIIQTSGASTFREMRENLHKWDVSWNKFSTTGFKGFALWWLYIAVLTSVLTLRKWLWGAFPKLSFQANFWGNGGWNQLNGPWDCHDCHLKTIQSLINFISCRENALACITWDQIDNWFHDGSCNGYTWSRNKPR